MHPSMPMHNFFGPQEEVGEGYSVKLEAEDGNFDGEVAEEEALIEALRTVHDPEIPVNLYDLGLIYRIDRADDGRVEIDMTLTAPGCPVAGQMPRMVAEAIVPVSGVREVEVTLVFDPPWAPNKMSDDARMALGMDM